MAIDLKPATIAEHSASVRARVNLPSADPARRATDAVTVQRAPVSGPQRSRESGGEVPGKASESNSLAAKAVRYGRWGLISQAQSRIASLQAAEQALVSAYRELLQVRRQLEQSSWVSRPGQANPLADRIDQLAREVRSAPAPLDPNLKPRVLQAGDVLARYALTRIDLLTPRDQPERLQLMFSGMRQAVELDLPPNADPDQVLVSVRAAVQPLHIGAELNASGQLEFSVPAAEQSRLNAPLLVAGQGIRVPAGNPVPIQLDAAPTPLEELAAGLRSANLVPQRQRIDAMLATLQESQRQLQQQTQQIMARLGEVRGAVAAAGDAVQIGEELAHIMRGADFGQHVSVLLAQANISRYTAVALMAR